MIRPGNGPPAAENERGGKVASQAHLREDLAGGKERRGKGVARTGSKRGVHTIGDCEKGKIRSSEKRTKKRPKWAYEGQKKGKRLHMNVLSSAQGRGEALKSL